MAQWKSVPFTPERSLVQSQLGPLFIAHLRVGFFAFRRRDHSPHARLRRGTGAIVWGVGWNPRVDDVLPGCVWFFGPGNFFAVVYDYSMLSMSPCVLGCQRSCSGKRVFVALGKIAALCAAALIMSAVPVASAHDVVISSDPADGSTVAEFPRRISLEFSGIPQETFNTIAVSNADTSEILLRTEPELDQQFVSVDIPEDIQPGPGNYIVGFQITSSDGHATRGKTTFSVGDATIQPSETTDTAVAAEEPEPNMLGWYLGGALLVIIAAGAAYVFFQRK